MTKDGPFHLPNGQEKQVPLMSHSGNFPYLRGDRFQAVSLPYGQGRVSMYIFLPNADSSLSEFLKELNAENWAKWMPQFGSTEVYLKVPRFKIEYSTSLEEPLKALGMGIALDRNLASFEGIRPAPPNLYIQQVKHKVFVEVNEEGTVAAAATHFSFGAGAAMPVQFVVDRPFFFAIRDNTTGTVLFMGAINEP
jgi:serpin B